MRDIDQDQDEGPVILPGPWTRPPVTSGERVAILARIAAGANNVMQVFVWRKGEFVRADVSPDSRRA